MSFTKYNLGTLLESPTTLYRNLIKQYNESLLEINVKNLNDNKKLLEDLNNFFSKIWKNNYYKEISESIYSITDSQIFIFLKYKYYIIFYNILNFGEDESILQSNKITYKLEQKYEALKFNKHTSEYNKLIDFIIKSALSPFETQLKELAKEEFYQKFIYDDIKLFLNSDNASLLNSYKLLYDEFISFRSNLDTKDSKKIENNIIASQAKQQLSELIEYSNAFKEEYLKEVYDIKFHHEKQYLQDLNQKISNDLNLEHDLSQKSFHFFLATVKLNMVLQKIFSYNFSSNDSSEIAKGILHQIGKNVGYDNFLKENQSKSFFEEQIINFITQEPLLSQENSSSVIAVNENNDWYNTDQLEEDTNSSLIAQIQQMKDCKVDDFLKELSKLVKYHWEHFQICYPSLEQGAYDTAQIKLTTILFAVFRIKDNDKFVKLCTDILVDLHHQMGLEKFISDFQDHQFFEALLKNFNYETEELSTQISDAQINSKEEKIEK